MLIPDGFAIHRAQMRAFGSQVINRHSTVATQFHTETRGHMKHIAAVSSGCSLYPGKLRHQTVHVKYINNTSDTDASC